MAVFSTLTRSSLSGGIKLYLVCGCNGVCWVGAARCGTVKRAVVYDRNDRGRRTVCGVMIVVLPKIVWEMKTAKRGAKPVVWVRNVLSKKTKIGDVTHVAVQQHE